MGVVRTALAGLGRIGWMLESDRLRYHPCTHAGSIRAIPAGRIVAGCDIVKDRRDAFAAWCRKKPAGRRSSGKSSLLETPILFSNAAQLATSIATGALPVDLVVLATGPDSHPGLFEQFLSAGVRRFVIEKPVALQASEARRMLRLAERAGASVHVNFERRYHPAYRLVRRVIEEGRFGPLRHIEGRVLAPSTDRDALLEDAVHWVDLLLWYAGDPLNVCSKYRLDDGERERSSLHIFEFDDFDAVLESGGARRYFEFQMRLDFERGRILAGNDGHMHFESRPSKRYRGFRELAPVSVRFPSGNPWVNLYREVLAESGCSSPLRDAVAGLEWIDRCKRFKRRARRISGS